MTDILIFVAVLVIVAIDLAPAGMLKDFWNMLWNKDSGYEEDL